jgi:HEAT repeat protein
MRGPILLAIGCLVSLAFIQGSRTSSGEGSYTPVEGFQPRTENPALEHRPKYLGPESVSAQDVNGLVETLSHNLSPDTDHGRRAILQSFWALQTIDGGRVAVPMLMCVFKEHGPLSGTVAGDLLEEIGPNAEGAVPGLVELLKSAREIPTAAKRVQRLPPSPSYIICDLLAAIGPKARAAAPVLLELLNDRDAKVRTAVAHALIQIRFETPINNKVIQSLLHDSNEKVRAEAVRKVFTGHWVNTSLAAMRHEIEGLLDDTSADVRVEAARALSKVEDSTDRVTRTLGDLIITQGEGNGRSRTSDALEMLAQLGPKARRATPRIREFLARHQGNSHRDYAVLALVAIEGTSDEATRDIIDMLKRQPVLVLLRGVTSPLLATKSPLRDASIQAVARLMDEKNGILEPSDVLELIGEIGGDAGPLVPLLSKMLHEESSFRRQMAARALGRIGPPARDALDALHGLATKDIYVRLQVHDAILRIQ